MQEYFEIGQIVNTFGIKGMVKVIPYTDDITRFDNLKNTYIVINHKKKQYEIQEVKYHKNMVLIKFKDIDTVEEGSYYIADLLQSSVYTETGKLLGTLEDIYNTGSNDIYVVKNEIGKQILLPAIEDVIKQICLEENKIIVKLPKGLQDV